MNPNTVISAAILVLAPVHVVSDFVSTTTKKANDTVQSAKDKMEHRRRIARKKNNPRSTR